MKKRTRGFTILELLVVVVIIAVLAVITVPHFIGAIEKSKTSRELAEVESVEKASSMFYMENGYYPTLQGEQPTFGDPKNIKFRNDENGNGLYPDFLKSLPHFSYWVIDYTGKVYHLYDDLGVIEKATNSITLDPKYTYSICNKLDNSVVESNVEGTAILTPEQYLKIIDSNGNELPSLDLGFDGLENHPESPEYKENNEDSATITYNKDVAKNSTGNIEINNTYANMYDGDLATYYNLSYGLNLSVGVSGIMTNRALSITYLGGSGGKITVLDISGQKLNFYTINPTTISYNNEQTIDGNMQTIQIIIPKEAAQVYIAAHYAYSMSIFEISIGDATLPDSVSGVSCVQNENNIELNWKNPKDTDFKQILIFRDGIYIGKTLGESFIDTPLLENYSYNYTLIAQDNDGNMSNSVDISAKTIKVGVVFRGANAEAFDKDETTYHPAPLDLTWDEDLTGKTLTLIYSGGGYSYFEILDSSGTPLTFTASGITSTRINMRGKSRGSYEITIPEGAETLKLRATQSGWSCNTLEITVD